MEADEKPILEVVKCSDFSKRILQLYNSGLPPGDSTQWPILDPYYTVQQKQWTLVTGVPSHGKSTWLDCLTINLAMIGWRFAVFSPEQEPTEVHMSLMAEKVQKKPFRRGFNRCMSKPELAAAIKFIDEHYKFIRCPEDSLYHPSLLDVLLYASQVFNQWRDEGFDGKCGLVIDPWNELNHEMMGEGTETRYICEMLTMLRSYTKKMDAHTWLVAHPKQMQKDKKTGDFPIPKPYDISGSAHWYNKADNCITVWRPEEGDITEIHVQKVRFRHIGKKGVVPLYFDVGTGTFSDHTPITRKMPVGVTQISHSMGSDF